MLLSAHDPSVTKLLRSSRTTVAVIVIALASLVAVPAQGQRAAPEPAPAAVPLVRLSFPQEDGSLTPYTFTLGYPLMTLVYDTLLWRDADGVPQPWLAQSVETSPDGLRVTVRLAEGVRWHDGVALSADDVAFTFAFVASHPHPQFTPQLQAVERVSAPDPATVVIVLRHPSPGFADQPLADLPILPAHLWRGLRPDQLAPDGLPVGSGPYRLVEHRPGQGYRFEANAGYFRGPPAVRVIDVPIITGADQTLRALARRRIDMVPAGLPPAGVTIAEEAGARLLRGPLYLGTVLVFNLRRAPFDQAAARQAVARALDVARITDIVGGAVPAERGLVHPDSPWASAGPVHAFDEAGARSALTSMGLGPLSILAPANDTVKLEAARQVALALERAGVKAHAQTLAADDVARALRGGPGAAPFDLAIATTSPLASYDPDGLVGLFAPGGAGAGYRSDRFDQLSARVATTADPPARRRAVGELLSFLATDFPVVPLFFASGAFAFRASVYDGWRFVKGSGILDKRSFLDPRPGPAEVAAPPPDEGPAGSGFPLGFAALAAVAIAAGLAAVGLLRGR